MDRVKNKKGQNPTFLFSIDANTFAIKLPTVHYFVLKRLFSH
jgi:hypothetical protein